MGLSKTDALRVAGAFGGGMGLMGHVCGAVTGALMTIGLKYAKTTDGEDDKKKQGYRLVQQFSRQFEQKHGAIHCRELIGVDLSTEAGMAKAQADGIFETQCRQYVADAADLLVKLLGAED